MTTTLCRKCVPRFGLNASFAKQFATMKRSNYANHDLDIDAAYQHLQEGLRTLSMVAVDRHHTQAINLILAKNANPCAVVDDKSSLLCAICAEDWDLVEMFAAFIRLLASPRFLRCSVIIDVYVMSTFHKKQV